MLVVHTVGTPATYAYLFFSKYRRQLVDLRNEELVEFHKDKLEANPKITDEERAKLLAIANDTVEAEGEEAGGAAAHGRRGSEELLKIGRKKTLPGYVRMLTDGYEHRTYWCAACTLPTRVSAMQPPT